MDHLESAAGTQKDGDAAIGRWLREDVAPVYDSMTADPARAIAADAVRSAILFRHDARLKSGRDA